MLEVVSASATTLLFNQLLSAMLRDCIADELVFIMPVASVSFFQRAFAESFIDDDFSQVTKRSNALHISRRISSGHKKSLVQVR